MADFIIQPKNDDHLKLNNDAGTTILELANDESKLRLAQNNISASDGTTAITTSGANVTFAGTVGNTGNNTITSGNLVIGTAGKGIDFSNASNSASGSTGALLDDFEKGGWNPVIQSASGTVSYSSYGWYRKIGDFVTCFFACNISSLNGGSGFVRLTKSSLPFNPESDDTSVNYSTGGHAVLNSGGGGDAHTSLAFNDSNPANASYIYFTTISLSLDSVATGNYSGYLFYKTT